MKFGNNWPNYFRGEVVSNYGRTTNGRRTGGQRRMTNLPILKVPSAHVSLKPSTQEYWSGIQTNKTSNAKLSRWEENVYINALDLGNCTKMMATNLYQQRKKNICHKQMSEIF